MYANKLAVALKVNNRILREFKDTVYVPFGSEYSVLVKNLNTKRAIINIFVDGTNVVPGGLVLNASQEIDLERSIVNGNLNAGNRFKFIERTGQIEANRGIKLEDGIIRVEYQYEHVYQTVWPNYTLGQPQWYGSSSTYHGGVLRSMTSNNISGPMSLGASATAKGVSEIGMNAILSSAESLGDAQSYNDAGITVAGSKSEQKFQTVSSFALEAEKHTMVLRLLGETPDNVPVLKPVTVKSKPKCVTCGTQNRAHAKFCVSCGTALEIFA